MAKIAAALVPVAAVLWIALGDGPPDLTITDARAVPVAGSEGRVRGFLTLSNAGPADHLIGVESREAATVTWTGQEGESGALPIPAEQSVQFAVDGVHLDLTGLSGDLGDGRLVPVTLEFAQSGKVSARLRVSAPAADGSAAAYPGAGVGDICIAGPDEPGPRVSASVAQNATGWHLTLATDDFSFEKTGMGGMHVPGEGHAHLFINGLKLGRLFTSEIRLPDLPAGRHVVRVALNTNDHRAYVVDGALAEARATLVTP